MGNKWNYFFILGLPIDPLPKTADIRQAIERKTQEWTADLQDPQKRETAEKWLAEIPAMRTALLLPANRMELAKEVNRIINEKPAELKHDLSQDWLDREIASLNVRNPASAIQEAWKTASQQSIPEEIKSAGDSIHLSASPQEQPSEKPVPANVTTGFPITAKNPGPAGIEEQVESLKATLRRDYKFAGQLPPRSIQDLLEKYPALTSNIVLYQFQAMKQEQEPGRFQRWQTDNDSQSSDSTSASSDKQGGMSPWLAGLIAIGIIAVIFFILLKFLPWWGAALGTGGIIALIVKLCSGGGSGGSIGGSGFSSPRIGG